MNDKDRQIQDEILEKYLDAYKQAKMNYQGYVEMSREDEIAFYLTNAIKETLKEKEAEMIQELLSKLEQLDDVPISDIRAYLMTITVYYHDKLEAMQGQGDNK